MINLHFDISNQLSTCRKINLLFINSTYLVFFSLKIQRRLWQTRVYCNFFYCLKRNVSQTFRNIGTGKMFSPLCMLLAQLALINVFIPCDNWKIFFFFKKTACLYSKVFSTAMFFLSFFEASELKELRILSFFISTILISKLKYNANTKVLK